MVHKIKLLHITSSLKMGGAEAVLCDLIEGLGSDEFEHQVIYFHDGPRMKQLRAMGVPLYQVKGFVCLYGPFFFVRLLQLIKKLCPDGIHSLLWSANVTSRVIARLLSIPHISVYHNNSDQNGRIRNLIDQLTRRFSTRLVAVSDEVAQSIGLSNARLKPSSVVVINNGIDTDSVRKKICANKITKTELGLSDDHFVFGSVGRFCSVKNYPLLLEAFSFVCKQHKQARLVLVGIGPDEQLLRRCAQRFGIADRVTFVVGKLAYGYYPLFDCFVQSSNKEGISIALLEAMSWGIPCVVTNSDAKHPVLTASKDGLVIQAGDAQALSFGLARLMGDRAFSRKLGKAGRCTVETDFSLERMVRAYRDLFMLFST